MSGNPTADLHQAFSSSYTIERELGRGGMATVYLARDRKHDREVALKILRPELAAILGRERFLNEIQLTARLDHPHILTLIDSGETGGFLWYVVPFIRGESLRAKLERERQLGLEEALNITRQVASALDYAHRQGASSTATSSRRTFCCTKARRCWRTSGSRWPCERPAAIG